MAQVSEYTPIEPVQYPNYPDVSENAYMATYGQRNTWWNRAFGSWDRGLDYGDWYENQIAKYNADIERYNAYMSSNAGRRADLENAGYNPNYTSGSVSSSGQLQHSPVSMNEGIEQVTNPLQTVLSFVSAIQNLRSQKLQNDKTQLQNIGQEITNADNAYLSDLHSLEVEQKLHQRFKNHPELWKGFQLGYNGHYYNLEDVDNVFSYQQEASDLAISQMNQKLQSINQDISKLSLKQRQKMFDVLYGKDPNSMSLFERLQNANVASAESAAGISESNNRFQDIFKGLGLSEGVVNILSSLFDMFMTYKSSQSPKKK